MYGQFLQSQRDECGARLDPIGSDHLSDFIQSIIGALGRSHEEEVQDEAAFKSSLCSLTIFRSAYFHQEENAKPEFFNLNKVMFPKSLSGVLK